MAGQIVPVRKIVLRPMGDNIMVKLEAADRKSTGGVLLPDTMRETSKRGKVMAVGNGRVRDNGLRVKPDVKEGDTVIFGCYAGSEVDPGDKSIVSIREHDIIAVIMSEETV